MPTRLMPQQVFIGIFHAETLIDAYATYAPRADDAALVSAIEASGVQVITMSVVFSCPFTSSPRQHATAYHWFRGGWHRGGGVRGGGVRGR